MDVPHDLAGGETDWRTGGLAEMSSFSGSPPKRPHALPAPTAWRCPHCAAKLLERRVVPDMLNRIKCWRCGRLVTERG